MTSKSLPLASIVYQVERMIKFEKKAVDSDGARWYYDPSERVLFVYGTDLTDLRDWKNNLNGSRSVSDALPGLRMSEGGQEYADKVVNALPPHAQVRQVYGHSLGADGAFRIGPMIGAELVVLLGCPRNVIASTKPNGFTKTCTFFDVTSPMDAVVQWVPWNERCPSWLGTRIRLPGKWFQTAWKPALGVLLGGLTALLLPLVGWLGAAWFIKVLIFAVKGEHFLPAYVRGLKKLGKKSQ